MLPVLAESGNALPQPVQPVSHSPLFIDRREGDLLFQEVFCVYPLATLTKAASHPSEVIMKS